MQTLLSKRISICKIFLLDQKFIPNRKLSPFLVSLSRDNESAKGGLIFPRKIVALLKC